MSGRIVSRGSLEASESRWVKKLLLSCEYYRWMRPRTYLFPGVVNHLRADKPRRMVWQAVREASTRAGIGKHVTPHTLRKAFSYCS